MPYFNIETNTSMDEAQTSNFLKKTSDFACRLLGKPEKYMMVSFRQGEPLMFGGTQEPAAYVELKSIGLPKDKCEEFSKNICEFIESSLGVQPDRIYIDFKDIDGSMFGWNKGTF